MATDSLLARVTVQFASHPENVATESLAFILGRSATARQAFIRFVERLGPKITPSLVFRTQAIGPDGSTPDLVGTDVDGREIVILEAKFWAGLTGNQPVAYLNRLPSNHAAILVVVTPALRLSLLSNELTTRCNQAGLNVGTERQLSAEMVVRPMGAQHFLAVISWRTLLAQLAQDLSSPADRPTISDLEQLQGLCDKMDDDAFLPLRSEELTSSFASRYLQFCRLVDDLVDRAVNAHVASIEGARTSSVANYYSRPMSIAGCYCYLQVNTELWSRHRATPLWLKVYDAQWKATLTLENKLAALRLEDPPRVVRAGSELVIPLQLPLGVERPAVLDHVFAQIEEVANLLSPRPATTPPSSQTQP